MSVKVPSTLTVTSHGLLIQSSPGIPVGAITSWQPKQSRAVTPVFEFGSVTDPEADSGEPYELVPGNVGGTDISIRRYDIYTNRFEVAFGSFNLQMLSRQDKPIRLIEFFTTPEGTMDFRYIYYGCWFTSLGRQHDAKGDRIVMVDATLSYVRRREA